jgi:CHAD domain-containing protein
MPSPGGVEFGGILRLILDRVNGAGRWPCGARLGDVAADLVPPLLRAVRRAGRRLHEDAPPEAFHRLRVRVKRLRYALETLRDLGGRRLGKALARLEGLQEVLGEHQDAVAQGARLRELAERSTLPPATLLAMGALMHVLGRRARRCRRRFRRPWKRFDRRRLRRRVLRELARHKRGARVVPLVRATGA